MNLDARRQALADRHQLTIVEYHAAARAFVELDRPDPLTGRRYKTRAWKAARIRVKQAAKAVARARPKRYTR